MAEETVPAGFSGSSDRTSEAVPMQRNRIVTAALAGGLVIGAAATGYVTARLTSFSGHGYAGQYQQAGDESAGSTPVPWRETNGTSPTTTPSSLRPPPPPATPDGGDTFSYPPLAQFIAQKAGTGLAGQAPQNVPLSQVKALSGQHPAGAGIDTRTGTITFHATTVSFTVVAIAPGHPDMTFTIAGLTNPTIIVPEGAQVTVRFINNDTDEAHGWLITGSKPPFGFGQQDTPAIAGAFAGIIGDPTAAGDGANTISFMAGSPGSYDYICPMPGHAQMGMHGSFIVR
jgi:rusticyanin